MDMLDGEQTNVVYLRDTLSYIYFDSSVWRYQDDTNHLFPQDFSLFSTIHTEDLVHLRTAGYIVLAAAMECALSRMIASQNVDGASNCAPLSGITAQDVNDFWF